METDEQIVDTLKLSLTPSETHCVTAALALLALMIDDATAKRLMIYVAAEIDKQKGTS